VTPEPLTENPFFLSSLLIDLPDRDYIVSLRKLLVVILVFFYAE